jgi:tetratricopeptide (TPR) repeat protein
MASLVALTVALSLFASPPQSQLAFGPEPSAADDRALSTDEHEAAKQAFDQGLSAVVNGEFDVAVEAFEQAYRLRPHPVTLFNLALALEKAKRLPEAWALFDEVVDLVHTNAERREVRRHMLAIEAEITIVQIDAHPRDRMCMDGDPVPRDEAGVYRLAVTPGRHEILVDERSFVVELTTGDRRVLLLEDRQDQYVERHRGPLLPTMLGLTIGGGVGALGFGVGAALATTDSTRTGLAVGAASSAGIAVIGGLVALAIERRANKPAPTTQPANDCPNSSSPGRLDLELAPTIHRPASFASQLTVPSTLGVPLDQLAAPTPAEFPHPRSIVPPRTTPPAGLAQNRPTTTTPM